MFSKNKKRKHRAYEGRDYPAELAQPNVALFIQTFEADLVRGPSAAGAAQSLEVLRKVTDDGQESVSVGDALIRWTGQAGSHLRDGYVEDGTQLGGGISDSHEGIWVDRYDARLLLEALPDFAEPSAEGSASPDGWSDLPSDTEDTFFFSVSEADDYRREKRRRVIDRDREARLQALRADTGEDEESDPRAEWGDSDEEPDEPQRELMRRTAMHVLSSPNSAQLEMRILANHGADPRFAFLRGRWSRAWRLAKGKYRLELEAEKKRKQDEETKSKTGGIFGGLAGYGDSEEEDEEEDVVEQQEVVPAVALEGENEAPEPATEHVFDDSDDALKAARRARAKEWAEKRRAAKGGNDQLQAEDLT